MSAAASASVLSLSDFWAAIAGGSKTKWTRIVEHVLHNYGTQLSCNRFAVGEVIEKCTCDFLNSVGIVATEVPSARRYDTRIDNVTGLTHLSLKFVSTGRHVVLHNSQRVSNTDMTLTPTLLFRLGEWWFLYPPAMEALGVVPSDYMKNTGDGLQLSFKVLEALHLRGYPYRLEHVTRYDKSACKMKATSDLLFHHISNIVDESEEGKAAKEVALAMDAAIPSRRPVAEAGAGAGAEEA